MVRKTERLYFHYEQLEEFQMGMWKIVRGEQRMENAKAAAQLMRDSQAFELAMRRALTEWPNSCAHNLTAENSNRLAWLGHAGNCLAVGSPEENTRIGWHMLTKTEQDEANRVAQSVLDSWIISNRISRQLDLFQC